MDDDFGVGMGAEDVAERFQFGNQLLEIVDFAIEHDDHRAVLVEQRLLAGRQVDDGQAPVSQPHAGFQMQAAFVGAAMKLGVVHAMQQFARNVVLAAKIENTGDAAHTCSFFLVFLSDFQAVWRCLSALYPSVFSYTAA